MYIIIYIIIKYYTYMFRIMSLKMLTIPTNTLKKLYHCIERYSFRHFLRNDIRFDASYSYSKHQVLIEIIKIIPYWLRIFRYRRISCHINWCAYRLTFKICSSKIKLIICIHFVTYIYYMTITKTLILAFQKSFNFSQHFKNVLFSFLWPTTNIALDLFHAISVSCDNVHAT